MYCLRDDDWAVRRLAVRALDLLRDRDLERQREKEREAEEERQKNAAAKRIEQEKETAPLIMKRVEIFGTDRKVNLILLKFNSNSKLNINFVHAQRKCS